MKFELQWSAFVLTQVTFPLPSPVKGEGYEFPSPGASG